MLQWPGYLGERDSIVAIITLPYFIIPTILWSWLTSLEGGERKKWGRWETKLKEGRGYLLDLPTEYGQEV